MSLNWKEIDAVLEEIGLPNSHIQKIRQPDFQSLIFDCYRPGTPFTLYISLKQGKTRIHLLTRHIKNEIKLQRFAQFLRSRIKGGRIVESGQVGQERIVKLKVLRGGETTLLWVRLWGGAANIIATDSSGTILDAFYRRPKRGEVSGGHFNPEHDLPPAKKEQKIYQVRQLPGTGTFNSKIESIYFDEETEQKGIVTQKLILDELEQRENGIHQTLSKLTSRLSEYDQMDQFRVYGDIITSHLHSMKKGETWLNVKNIIEENTEVSIELKPELSPPENAENYYKKYRKAKSGQDILRREILELEKSLDSIHLLMEETKAADDVETLGKLNSRVREERRGKSASAEKEDKKTPGLSFSSGIFRILVGRSARENDQLLRKHVKGNDLWLHTRDYPGAYVFIKSVKGKTVPLDTLLDAGNLALHYSRGKTSGRGDLYYTQVKYLKRPKDGKLGLVLPTQEKNLSVILEQKRIKRLQGSNTPI